MLTLNSDKDRAPSHFFPPLVQSMQSKISEVLEKVLSGKERSTEREEKWWPVTPREDVNKACSSGTVCQDYGLEIPLLTPSLNWSNADDTVTINGIALALLGCLKMLPSLSVVATEAGGNYIS